MVVPSELFLSLSPLGISMAPWRFLHAGHRRCLDDKTVHNWCVFCGIFFQCKHWLCTDDVLWGENVYDLANLRGCSRPPYYTTVPALTLKLCWISNLNSKHGVYFMSSYFWSQRSFLKKNKQKQNDIIKRTEVGWYPLEPGSVTPAICMLISEAVTDEGRFCSPSRSL